MNIDLQLFVKLSLALLFSFLIGLEREKAHKAAGLRSCMLLCFCMTLMMIINIRLNSFFTGHKDILRLPAYCIMSVGFIGSGVIICYKNKLKETIIEGITTACVLLTLVAIGVACGIQEYFLAGVSTLVVYGILKLGHLEKLIKQKSQKTINK